MCFDDLISLFDDLELELIQIEDKKLELIQKAEKYYNSDSELIDTINLAHATAVLYMKEKYLHELNEVIRS